ncbi:MAG: DUF711 family protein [Sedimentisphaerales bacterium]|nr:DUF711 family protein [Sedimentisphaerales bacterium]
MRIRSITCFVTIDDPASQADTVRDAGLLAADAREALETAGFPVQTARLATQPLSLLPAPPLDVAAELWPACLEAGFEYLSLGPVLGGGPDADLSRLDLIPELIQSTDAVFAGVLAADVEWGIRFEAVRRTAGLVRAIAGSTDQGFGNLRLAMLANVGPHAPFFPAAYHDGGPPAVALATESADLAVDAFTDASSVDEARDRLVGMVEDNAALIVDAVAPLAEAHGFRFPGIDFSLAPFPEEARSIGAAVERLGVDRFGAPGTLFAASLLTECLRRAEYPHTGFNGLMLPVLEDAVLAQRSMEEMFTVNDLLLYSAVCGTGLDTVPLPGDVSEEELAGILLDVAALAVRLDKPLTARLMPVPGLSAGDVAGFEFEYFANGRVLGVKGWGSERLF